MFFDMFLKSRKKPVLSKNHSSVILHQGIKGNVDDTIKAILHSAGNPGDG